MKKIFDKLFKTPVTEHFNWEQDAASYNRYREQPGNPNSAVSTTSTCYAHTLGGRGDQLFKTEQNQCMTGPAKWSGSQSNDGTGCGQEYQSCRGGSQTRINGVATKICYCPLACDRAFCGGHGTGTLASGICSCNCDDGYEGNLCQTATAIPCTAQADCSNHGSPGNGETRPNCNCTCDNGYEGNKCQTASACTAGANGQACQNNGSATGTTGNCGCSCATGYEGANCQTASACTAGANGQACQNNGSATGTTGNCGCSCTAGYGGANCQTASACTAGANGQECQNKGRATGTAGNCGCSCVDGYEGANCQTAKACTARKVANSDKSGDGSITGNFGTTVTVKCNDGYTGGGTWTCGADGNFSGTACSARNVPCTSADDCNNHAASVTGDKGSCKCTCAIGYTGDTCDGVTSCTTAGNCSGNASAVSGSVHTGCTCTCNDGYGGGDCSQTLTACDTSNCGGKDKSNSATGYSETGCTCQCNDRWEGANCETESNPDANPCHQVGVRCINNGNYDGAPDATSKGGPGTCTCIGCARGYTDAEGACSITAHRTRAECEAASPAAGIWTPAIGYKCNIPNESCTLSTDDADRNNAATAENGVFYCAAGSIATINPYSPNGRTCGCECGYGDQEKWTCENSALDIGNLQGSCENNAACSYDGSRLTCQPTGYAACALNTDSTTCASATDCSWEPNTGCTVSETAKSTCLAMSESACTAGSGCTLRGVCNVSASENRTGYGGPHCTVAQDVILSSSAQTENLAKGIIWCNENGVASGKTGNAYCTCFPGWSGDACQTSGGTECGNYGKKTSEGAGSYQCICEGNWSKSGTLNSDGVAMCDVDPCHEGVTQEVAVKTSPDEDKHIFLLNPPLKSPSIVKGMGISWAFADSGLDLPARGRPLVTIDDAQKNIAVESVAPPGSREVTAAMENGNDLNAIQGRAVDGGAEGALPELNQDQQKELFMMQGVHAKNDTAYWRVIPTYGTFLPVGTLLNFFHKTQGGPLSCRIFDKSEGADRAECKVVHGTKRSCGCAQGWDMDMDTELCTVRCPYGTWGPGCRFRMDGRGSPNPKHSNHVEDLCKPETLDDETIASLMKYNTEHGQPSRLAIDAAQITPQTYKQAMAPKKGHADCRVVETGQYTNKEGVTSLDIQYDCHTNPNNSYIDRGAQGAVSSQWQKGSTQTPDTVKGGWVIDDNEGQCLRPNPLAWNPDNKVLCEHKETNKPIRENEGYAETDCVVANVDVIGGGCYKGFGSARFLTETKTKNLCEADGGTWEPGQFNCEWKKVDVHQQCHPDNENLVRDFDNVADREKCRVMECSSTACGPLTGDDTYYAKKEAGTDYLTNCIKHTAGGAAGTNTACTVPTSGDDYTPITLGMMTKTPAGQFKDGACYGSHRFCDNCKFLWGGDKCGAGAVYSKEKTSTCGGWNSGGYYSCVYDLDTAPECGD